MGGDCVGWVIVIALIVGPILLCIWGEIKEKMRKPEWMPPERSSNVASMQRLVNVNETQKLLQS